MLLSYIEFLVQVSPSAARRLLYEYKKIVSRLEENPYQFPYADEYDIPGIPPKKYRGCIIKNRYKALFLIENVIVYIDAIIDCRQENNNLY